MGNANRAPNVPWSPILDFIPIFITIIFTPENHVDRVKNSCYQFRFEDWKRE